MATRWALRPALRSASRASVSSGGRISQVARWLREERRHIRLDHRNRLSNIWVPAPQVMLKDAKENEESHAKLTRAGFFRQAHAGVFHMLPLGLRVQDKIEALVDKHMKAIGASRVSLSSISSAKLWSKSGRLESIKAELFQFSDRKDAKYLLSPTHEEEITELVSQNVVSYRGLPLRLYQITRKYRDEMRPRHGILRSREFVMKDLYSFDASVDDALATYEQVRGAYDAIFAALKVPVLAARASSGDMGGDLSHEYLLAAPLGEDDVAHCGSCGFAANTEVLEVPAPTEEEEAGKQHQQAPSTVKSVRAWRGISWDRSTLVNVWYPAEAVDGATGRAVAMSDDDINVHAVKAAVPGLDASIENPAAAWNVVLARAAAKAKESPFEHEKPRIVNLVDWRLRGVLRENSVGQASAATKIDTLSWPSASTSAPAPGADDIAHLFAVSPATATTTGDAADGGRGFNFAKARTGDDCASCGGRGTLAVDRAIELGHTFYLGTRYTAASALDVKVQAPREPGAPPATIAPLMGCYGLGISRILGAVADHRADGRGLNWPRAIAPYEVVVVAAPLPKGGAAAKTKGGLSAAAEGVYDELARTDGGSEATAAAAPGLDVLLDDRDNASLPYKLTDADLTGYPVVVVVGATWRKSVGDRGGVPLDGVCEVQCRQLGVKQDVPLRDLRAFVGRLLDQL